MSSRKPRKLQAPRTWFRKPVFKVFLSVLVFSFIAVSVAALHYYRYYSQVIDRKLDGEVFQRTARLYATPYPIYPGRKLTAENVVARLQRAGFEPEGGAHGGEGTYTVAPGRVTIKPEKGDGLQLRFEGGTLTRIVNTRTGQLGEATLPAELITNFSDQNRQKRRIVEFKELPSVLVHALIAAEDNRFYRHYGIDPIRLAGAIFQSGGSIDRVRGTSTITQQLARNFFLTAALAEEAAERRRSPVRKAHEIFIALLLEQRLTKEQILTLYANDVYLGARGSFMIKGFGEGAAAYFGKDLTALTLPEAATLAAIIPAPSGTFSPIRHPDRAKERRNLVLNSMVELGFIGSEEAEKARAAELKLARFKADVSDAPYFVDYVRDILLRDFSEEALNDDGLRVQTTLDPDLQRAAVDAVSLGLKDVSEVIAERNRNRKEGNKLPEPQAALIVLDTKTAAIRAMSGGGDYGESQLNRITQAFRQPGSIFKPFVYAAAFEECERLVSPLEMEAGLGVLEEPDTNQPVVTAGEPEDCITPVTVFNDEPTTFVYDGEKTYEPNNYHAEYNGQVTVRYALQRSLNIPTIKIAEAIGFDKVADLALRAGLNARIKAYPSVALGAFEVTPLEMAGAYTIFANEGKRLEPHGLTRILASDGSTLKNYTYPEEQVLSPQVAYLMTDLLEGVIKQGTGGGVLSRGFHLPAAAKTGTSRDGWFAGYTKDFIAIAWVGFDDNTDLNLEGARSALPIWAEFMKKAQELYPPRDLDRMYFSAPTTGIEFAVIRPGDQAILGCSETYVEGFLAGTVPNTGCSPRRGVIPGFFGEFGRALGNFFGFGGRSSPPSEAPEEPSTFSR